MKSWRTSVGGIALILTALLNAASLLLDGKPDTNPNWSLLAGEIVAGWALLQARDNKVSSESAGAK